jgi:hypothetical protein
LRCNCSGVEENSIDCAAATYSTTVGYGAKGNSIDCAAATCSHTVGSDVEGNSIDWRVIVV